MARARNSVSVNTSKVNRSSSRSITVPSRPTLPHRMPAPAQLRERRSDEHASSGQPVPHPADRLTFLEEARPHVIIPTGPTDRPAAGAHPLDELEPVSASHVDYLFVRDSSMVPPRYDGDIGLGGNGGC